MFLWFCAAHAILTCAIVIGYLLSNPDQLPFTWPRVGRGAIVSSGRIAVETYERGGQPELARYLGTLAQDTGLKGHLFDALNREVSGSEAGMGNPGDLTAYPEGQLTLRVRERLAVIRLRGGSGRSYVFVTTVPPRDGSGFWSRTFLVSLAVTGALLCYLLARYVTAPVVHLREWTSRFSRGDLTARITLPGVLKRKDEIGGLACDFNRMASRIETLMKAQQRLIADVSHELRSPITRLSLALGLVRREKQGGQQMSLARMEREVERLNALISQLLTLSRLESMDHPPPMETFDLSALIKEIASDADFEAVSLNRGVQLAGCDACSISGARDLIRSAVENVVRNAVKYTSPNTEVLIRLVHSGDTATIVVEDHGPGAPAEALEHIFEPFYRVEEARDRRSGGAGLGLAITHQIVTLHGGSVRAANREAGGLELRITLPTVSEQRPMNESARSTAL
jgi:two-component system sensor histidine kinase CpxA